VSTVDTPGVVEFCTVIYFLGFSTTSQVARDDVGPREVQSFTQHHMSDLPVRIADLKVVTPHAGRDIKKLSHSETGSTNGMVKPL
jgi:hypothetical protein